MATIPSGQVVRIQIPSAQSLTFTPGTGGRISLNGRTLFGEAITPREIYVATSISFSAGDVVTAEAVNGDATHTDPSAGAGSTAYSDLTGVPTDNPALSSALDGKVPTTRTVNGQALSGNVTLAKSDVGLGNVDNTSDASKPISTATQTALDAKAPTASPAFTGTATGANVTLTGTLAAATVTASGNATVTGTTTTGTLTVNTTANVPTITSVADSTTKAVNSSFLNNFDKKRGRIYNPPTPENPFAAETAVTSPTLDWTNTFITDGNGQKIGWAGNGVESVVTMSDGTKFFRYTDGSSNEKLLRSPTGGDTGSGQAWTTIDTQTGSMDYTILLRDPVTDTLLYFVAVGSDSNWVLRCKAFNSAGTQQGSTYDLPQSAGFLEGLSTNPYIRGGIGPDGRFVLVQPYQNWPAQSMQRTQTLNLNRLILSGMFSTATNTFTFDPVFRQFMQERTAYDIPFVGLNGDPDYICGICGRDVRNDEDKDYVTGLNGTLTSTYNFDQVGFWYYNRRTQENGFWWVTEKLGMLNTVNKARVTYGATSTSIIIHEIVQGTIRGNQSITNLSNITGGITNGSTVTGSPAGTVGSTFTISAATGATAQTAPGVLISLTDINVPTTQKRYFQAIQTNDGYIMFAYINVRHSHAASGITTGQSVRVMKLSAMGAVIYDEDVFHEAAGYGQNYHALWQNASSNAVYVIRLCNQGGGSSSSTDFAACRLREDVTFTANITTNGTTTATVNSTSAGFLYPGCRIAGGTLATNTRVTKWGTYSPATGTGTIFIDKTPGSSTATMTGWARVATENPYSGNTLYSQWGAARAPNFVPFIPDNRSGSKVGTNVAEMFIPRRANDFPTNTSSTTTDKIDHAHVRLPA